MPFRHRDFLYLHHSVVHDLLRDQIRTPGLQQQAACPFAALGSIFFGKGGRINRQNTNRVFYSSNFRLPAADHIGGLQLRNFLLRITQFLQDLVGVPANGGGALGLKLTDRIHVQRTAGHHRLVTVAEGHIL